MSMDTRKRLWFEDGVHDDMGIKGTEQISLPDGLILVEDMLNITQSEILSSDDEFSMLCVEETGPSNWPFSPITNASQQELGPLVENVYKEKSLHSESPYMVMGIVTSGHYHTFFLV